MHMKIKCQKVNLMTKSKRIVTHQLVEDRMTMKPTFLTQPYKNKRFLTWQKTLDSFSQSYYALICARLTWHNNTRLPAGPPPEPAATAGSDHCSFGEHLSAWKLAGGPLPAPPPWTVTLNAGLSVFTLPDKSQSTGHGNPQAALIATHSLTGLTPLSNGCQKMLISWAPSSSLRGEHSTLGVIAWDNQRDNRMLTIT